MELGGRGEAIWARRDMRPVVSVRLRVFLLQGDCVAGSFDGGVHRLVQCIVGGMLR